MDHGAITGGTTVAGRSVSFPLDHGMARGYLARSAAGHGEGILVIDPSWDAESEHHPRCDELAARGFTALVVELRSGNGRPLNDDESLVVLREGAAYLGFHPSVSGRPVHVEGDPELIEACLVAMPALRRLNQ